MNAKANVTSTVPVGGGGSSPVIEPDGAPAPGAPDTPAPPASEPPATEPPSTSRIGDMVYFYKNPTSPPSAAIITKFHNPASVRLTVFSEDGQPPFVQPYSRRDESPGDNTWRPR